MKYNPKNRQLNISTSNTMKVKNNHSFFKSTFKLSASRFNLKRNICCLRSDKGSHLFQSLKMIAWFFFGFCVFTCGVTKTKETFPDNKTKIENFLSAFPTCSYEKKYKLKLIKFTSSARPTNLVFSIDIIKSKKGSKPALYPGEFSCT